MVVDTINTAAYREQADGLERNPSIQGGIRGAAAIRALCDALDKAYVARDEWRQRADIYAAREAMFRSDRGAGPSHVFEVD